MSKTNNFNDELNKIKEKYGNFSREESDFLYDNEYVYSKKDFNNLKSFKESFIKYFGFFTKEEFDFFRKVKKYELGEAVANFSNQTSIIVKLNRQLTCLSNFDKLRNIDFNSEEKIKDTYFNICYKFSHNGNDDKVREQIVKEFIDKSFLLGFLINLSKEDYDKLISVVQEKRRLK